MEKLTNTLAIREELLGLLEDFQDMQERYTKLHKAAMVDSGADGFKRGLYGSRVDSFKMAGEWLTEIIEAIEFEQEPEQEDEDVMYNYRAMLLMEDTMRGDA